MLKQILIALLVSVVVVLLALSFYSPTVVAPDSLGATYGSGSPTFGTQEISTSGNIVAGGNLSIDGTVSFSGVATLGTLVQGGGIRATSTSSAVIPLLASDFDTENVIDVTLNVQDATLSFPASSTITSLSTAGQMRTIFVRNASTTAAMDLTITGGTGVLLKKATTTAVIAGDTDGGNYARIDLLRKSDTDIEALLNIFVD